MLLHNELHFGKIIDDFITASATHYKNLGFQTFQTPDARSELTRSKFKFTSSVFGMQAVSRVIENEALGLKRARFYSGFQKLSRAVPHLNLYKQVAAAGNCVAIFGIPDTQLKPAQNFKIVPLAGKDEPNLSQPNLTRNWFVILDCPGELSIALVTRELPKPYSGQFPDKLIYRHFEGFWTYDKEVISQLAGTLDEFMSKVVSVC